MRTNRTALPAVLTALLLLASTAPAARGQAVEGSVVSRDDGVPMDGARVLLLSADGEVADSTLTDSAGGFLVAAASPGTYYVHVQRAGYASYTSPPLPLEPGQVRAYRMELPLVSVRAIEQIQQVLGAERRFDQGLPAACGEALRPWEAGILYGVVRDRQSKEPVPGALVVVTAPGAEVADEALTAVAGEGGTYLVCNVPPGPDVGVSVRAAGYRSREITVEVRLGMVGWYDLFIRRRRDSSTRLRPW